MINNILSSAETAANTDLQHNDTITVGCHAPELESAKNGAPKTTTDIVKEIAAVLRVSEETVTRDWRLEKIWLRREVERAAIKGASTAGSEFRPRSDPGSRNVT
jgi:hypothetical protein